MESSFAPEPEKKGPQRAICISGYLHDASEGRVQCEHCGRRAFSRSAAAIALWADAHTKCCKGIDEGVPVRAYAS